MVDTQRFRLGPDCVRTVDEVATEVAKAHDGRVHALQVTTYLPLDVESVARVLDSLEETGVERIEEDGLRWYKFVNLDRREIDPCDLKGAYLEERPGFHRNLSALLQDPEWQRKAREHHELLFLAASSKRERIDLAWITSRTDIPSARIQSALNALEAEGYIQVDYDESEDQIQYTFPPLEYPAVRKEQNMQSLSKEVAQSRAPAQPVRTLALGAMMLVALAVILFLVLR